MKRTLGVVLLGTLLLLPPLVLGGEAPAPPASKTAQVRTGGECSVPGRAMEYLCTARAMLRLVWRVTRDLARDASQKDTSVTYTSASVVKQIAMHRATTWLASAPLQPLTRPSATPTGSGQPLPPQTPYSPPARHFHSCLRINP